MWESVLTSCAHSTKTAHQYQDCAHSWRRGGRIEPGAIQDKVVEEKIRNQQMRLLKRRERGGK